jgi:deoxyribodipyrimidine photolyase-related protein
MSHDGKPGGGAWNFDQENRNTFGAGGPDSVPAPPRFRPDQSTRAVLAVVASRFSNHPGGLAKFDLAVTSHDAHCLLDHFTKHALPQFGRYQDAMWCGEPFLYHSRLSSSLNLKLLNPRECVSAATAAYERGSAPLNSVEGFVRQVLGWREYIRGIYWSRMPNYRSLNYFGHTLDVPPFYWDGNTDMACVHDCMRQVLEHGYTHHIVRLMVFGLLAQLVGVDPRRFHEWHMAMYVDAVDWVSLPNALGMSQYADGGIVGTKPYCATGNYLNRMSNYCGRCRYSPKVAIGENACPFTTLYWDFLDRHYRKLLGNARLAFQIRNLERKRSKGELAGVRRQAEALRTRWSS